MRYLLSSILFLIGFNIYGQKISALPEATTVSSGALFVIVQSDTTWKVVYDTLSNYWMLKSVYDVAADGTVDSSAIAGQADSLDSYDSADFILKSIGTTAGDIIYWSGVSTPARLAIGASSGDLLRTSAGGIPEWFTPSYLVSSNNLSDLGSAETARTNLGLGSFATISSLAHSSTTGITANDHWVGNSNAGGYELTNLGEVILGSITSSSADPYLTIARALTGSGNAHAFVDESSINKSGTIGYNSFDADASITGSNNYDHMVGFQSRPYYNSSGTIARLNGFTSLIDVNNGTVTELANYKATDVDTTGGNGATITTQYGFFISEALASAGTNWGYYDAGNNKHDFGDDTTYVGDLIIEGFIVNRPVTYTNDLTPSVANASTIYLDDYTGTPTITNFDFGAEGKEITIIHIDDDGVSVAITIQDGANMYLNGSTDFVMNAGDVLRLKKVVMGTTATPWVEIGRSDN